MKKAIGIDIGGTKISIVSGTERGKILTQEIISTLTGSRTPEGIEMLLSRIELVRRKTGGKIEGIGVGIPGPVDSSRGIVPRSPHLTGWEGVKLKSILERKLKLPVLMGNDANAAALGEKGFGQGRGKSEFIYITVSTGIGGGIITGGKLLEGVSFVAGEIGHMKIVPDGLKCKCGGSGCWEAYASGTAIARAGSEAYRKAGKADALKKLTGGAPASAMAFGLAAKKGDKISLEVYREAGFYLGVGVASLLNILNPELIIFGGGVWRSSPDIFWNTMIKTCSRDAWPQAFDAVKIARSNLGGHSGDLGALALGFESGKA